MLCPLQCALHLHQLLQQGLVAGHHLQVLQRQAAFAAPGHMRLRLLLDGGHRRLRRCDNHLRRRPSTERRRSLAALPRGGNGDGLTPLHGGDGLVQWGDGRRGVEALTRGDESNQGHRNHLLAEIRGRFWSPPGSLDQGHSQDSYCSDGDVSRDDSLIRGAQHG